VPLGDPYFELIAVVDVDEAARGLFGCLVAGTSQPTDADTPISNDASNRNH
jgi:hypothetical protein